MSTIFDESSLVQFLDRIHKLDMNLHPKWGKMNPYQMGKHCRLSDGILLGHEKFNPLFIGKLFGPKILKRITKDDAPLKRNQSTHPKLKIKETGDFDAERAIWVALLQEYSLKSPSDYKNFIHPFFGKMNYTDIGVFAYKHIDHHLNQFNC